MAPSVYRHSDARLWAGRHPWVVRLVAAVVVAAAAAGATLALAGGHGAPAARSRRATTVAPPGPFVVSGTTPAPSTQVASDVTVQVRLSHPADMRGPLPALDPPVPGSWAQGPQGSLVFRGSAPLLPGSSETLTVPGGPSGIRDAAGHTLAGTLTVPFTVQASTERLQQLLAELGYLPVSFTPLGPEPAGKEMAQSQPGNFAWRWADPLSGLEDHWAAGEFGVMTQAAVMTFQDQHHLPVDGLAGPRLWHALLAAAASGSRDTAPYDYAFVDKTPPEHLVLYVDGVAKFPDVPVNTGLHGADTPDGTYPVFEHLTASEMKGTNPDGSTYDDPNVPWASYFYQGDALHGFVRPSYGSPQSNGCVEMPVDQAGALWPFTPIGTLVTVVGPPS